MTKPKWLRSGKLKGVRAGKLWRISTESLDEFLKKDNSEDKS
ncbi:MAG: helix-turn-helix domain-containing protein [Nanoarchaeota archaeon]|nr:helix-turn-helix domain-containing protein [Nanoarchaeota archaeon]